MLNILVFDLDPEVRSVLGGMVTFLLPKSTVFTAGDVLTAKHLIDRQRPQLVITEAIPAMDVLHPAAVQMKDQGTELITHIRQHEDSQVRRTWIIVTMSRLSEDVPEDFRHLLGERAHYGKKPEVMSELPTLLPILAATLTRNNT